MGFVTICTATICDNCPSAKCQICFEYYDEEHRPIAIDKFYFGEVFEANGHCLQAVNFHLKKKLKKNCLLPFCFPRIKKSARNVLKQIRKNGK